MMKSKIVKDIATIVSGFSVFTGVGIVALTVEMADADAQIMLYEGMTDAPSNSPGRFVGSLAPNALPDDDYRLTVMGNLDPKPTSSKSTVAKDPIDWYSFTLIEDAVIAGINFGSTSTSPPKSPSAAVILDFQLYETTGVAIPKPIEPITTLKIGGGVNLPDAASTQVERLFTAGTYYVKVSTPSLLNINRLAGYQFTIEFTAPSPVSQELVSVPEPTSIIGLLAIGGLAFGSKLKKQQ